MQFKIDLSKNTSVLLPQKMHLKKTFQSCSLKKCISKTHAKLLPQKHMPNCSLKKCITNIFFISASINAVKSKADINKSLIMHD